jgi:hypothetical protein
MDINDGSEETVTIDGTFNATTPNTQMADMTMEEKQQRLQLQR